MTLMSVEHPTQSPHAQDALPAELHAALTGLKCLMPHPGDMLPADPEILQRLWPRSSELQPASAVRLIERLQALGLVRRLIVGREPHLCLGESLPPPMAALQESSTARPQPEAADLAANHHFQLQLAMDVESERILLYRVGIVLALLGLFVLMRHCLLWYLQQ